MPRPARSVGWPYRAADLTGQRHEPYSVAGDGANDYILKTTPPAVLLARLRLHLRQHASSEREVPAQSLMPHKAMRFGTLSIDPVNRQVLLSGELIALYRRF